ncbi:LexA family transcriptional regulator [Sphingobacteriaceae bacterium AH-315-L07]|nr:LexA family transcriptional regulator [Sphingobacteriaceae bacterium AH-315-L07]
MHFPDNLKLLRTKRNISQTALAIDLELSRTTLIGYEKGVQPPFKTLVKIAEYFKVSLDALIRYDLNALSDFDLSEIEKGYDIDITGSKLRLLTISIDKDDRENIDMVSVKAQAGYTTGYGDPNYISELPKFQLPFLARNKTYRCFQIKGDSMPPVSDKYWVTASYIENWTKIKDGHGYVILTKDDGVVFKIVYNKIESDNSLLLVSTNREYEPYHVNIEEVMEVWQFETYNGFNLSF